MLGLTVFPIFVNNFHFALTLQTVPLLALSAEPSSGEFFGRKDGRGRGQTCVGKLTQSQARVQSRETRKRAFV